MQDLNFRHLLYLYTVAREGSVTAAARALHVTQPTVSAQLKELERTLGQPLLQRAGRGVELTDAGRTAYAYAERIFSLGRDMVEAVKHHRDGRDERLVVGISDGLPKFLTVRLLEPVLRLTPAIRLDCRQDRPGKLLQSLGDGELEVVLTDAPVRADTPVRAFNHALGESGMSFFAAPALATEFEGRFPAALDGAPILLPSRHTVLRGAIDRWLDDEDLLPHIVAEFDDAAHMNAFGQAGLGVFAAPTIIEREIAFDYHVDVIGRAPSIRERLYAISTERKVRHPAVIAITEHARTLFEPPQAGELF